MTETYRWQMKDMKQKAEDTWAMISQRQRSLARKWMNECDFLQEVADIVAAESVSVVMLKWLAAWLKDMKLKSLEQLADMADNNEYNRASTSGATEHRHGQQDQYDWRNLGGMWNHKIGSTDSCSGVGKHDGRKSSDDELEYKHSDPG